MQFYWYPGTSFPGGGISLKLVDCFGGILKTVLFLPV